MKAKLVRESLLEHQEYLDEGTIANILTGAALTIGTLLGTVKTGVAQDSVQSTEKSSTEQVDTYNPIDLVPGFTFGMSARDFKQLEMKIFRTFRVSIGEYYLNAIYPMKSFITRSGTTKVIDPGDQVYPGYASMKSQSNILKKLPAGNRVLGVYLGDKKGLLIPSSSLPDVVKANKIAKDDLKSKGYKIIYEGLDIEKKEYHPSKGSFHPSQKGF